MLQTGIKCYAGNKQCATKENLSCMTVNSFPKAVAFEVKDEGWKSSVGKVEEWMEFQEEGKEYPKALRLERKWFILESERPVWLEHWQWRE